MPRYSRFSPFVRFYDALSGEWPVYRVGRVLGVAALGLRPGARVLDVGCGTGLNFPLLRDAVGPGGRVVGVDSSSAMLARARARTATAGWGNVDVRAGDASRLDETAGSEPFDAVLYTYALSIIDGWERSFAQAKALVRPGGCVCVVDMALPRGRWRWLSPAARLACFAGGADPRRHPWRLIETQLADVRHEVRRGGHVHVVSGTVESGTVGSGTVGSGTV